MAQHARVIQLRPAAPERPAREVRPRRVTLHCQDCGSGFRYVYPGTGPYRSFCRQCRPYLYAAR